MDRKKEDIVKKTKLRQFLALLLVKLKRVIGIQKKISAMRVQQKIEEDRL